MNRLDELLRGRQAFSTAWPSVRSRTRSTKSLTTLKLTSASRSARRTSRNPSRIFSSVSRVRPPSARNAPDNLSDRLSEHDLSGKCRCLAFQQAAGVTSGNSRSAILKMLPVITSVVKRWIARPPLSPGFLAAFAVQICLYPSVPCGPFSELRAGALSLEGLVGRPDPFRRFSARIGAALCTQWDMPARFRAAGMSKRDFPGTLL